MLAGGALLAADCFTSLLVGPRDRRTGSSSPRTRTPVLVGSRDYAVEPIAAWTKRPFYYPDQRRFGTFMDWGPARVEVGAVPGIESGQTPSCVQRVAPVLLVLSGPPGETGARGRVALRPGLRVRYVARFDGAIVVDENYRVFLLDRQRERCVPGSECWW